MMKFNFKKKLLSSAMAVAMVSGLAMSGNANAIHISTEGKGQILMSPLYLADLGYNSKVTIVNTNDKSAVKVRIALRSQIYSNEFDFICLMTPSDVCSFEIVKDPVSGQAYIKSTDDSILASEIVSTARPNEKPVFASQCASSNPAEVGELCKDGYLWKKIEDWALTVVEDPSIISKATIPATNVNKNVLGFREIDWNEIGHIEVIGAVAMQGRIQHPAGSAGGVTTYPAGSVLIQEGMSKDELYKLIGPEMKRTNLASVSNDQNEVNSFATGRRNQLGTCVVEPFNITDSTNNVNDTTRIEEYGIPCNVNSGILPFSKIRSTTPDWVQLTGQIEMNNGVDRMGLTMTALAGDIWDNIPSKTHNPPYGLRTQALYRSPDFNGNGIDESQAFDGRTISSPVYDVEYASDILLGATMGGSRVGLGETLSQYDNIIEIENALASQKLQGNYTNTGVDITNVIITFPTKYRHDNRGIILVQGRSYETPGSTKEDPQRGNPSKEDRNSADVCASPSVSKEIKFYPPFRPEGSIDFNIITWDEQENKYKGSVALNKLDIFSPGAVEGPGSPITITDEVNYIQATWPTEAGFENGWFSLELQATAGCQYNGAPVLAYAHKTQAKNGGFINSWLVPLAQVK